MRINSAIKRFNRVLGKILYRIVEKELNIIIFTTRIYIYTFSSSIPFYLLYSINLTLLLDVLGPFLKDYNKRTNLALFLLYDRAKTFKDLR